VDRVYSFLIKTALPLAGVVGVTLIPASLLSSRIETNNTVDTFLVQDDPDLAFYRETTDRFGGDLLVYVSMDLGDADVFTVESLTLLDSVTRTLEDLDGVVRVSSLASTEAIFDDDGIVEPGPLMEQVPTTAEEVVRIRDKVVSSALLPWYVSLDRRATLLVAEADPELGAAELNAVIRALHEAVQAVPEAEFSLAGNPVFAEAIDRFNARDQQLFSGLMLMLVLLSSALWLRRLSAAVLPVVVVMVTVMWTTGLFVAAGHATNWITGIISPILFLIGTASAVHLLSAYRDALASAEPGRAAILAALRRVAVPCFFTSMTTAAGFASLMANRIMPVKVFGLFACIGVMLAFVATVVVVPAGLLATSRFARRRPLASAPPSRLLAGLDQVVQQRPGLVLIVSLLVVAGLGAGVAFMRVETNNLKYFRPSAPVVRHSLEIEQRYGGSAPLDIVIDTGRPDGALEPELLAAVAELQRRLDDTEGMARGISLADLLQDLHRAMSGDRPTGDLPASADAAYQLLMLPDPDMVDRIVDTDRRLTRISTRFTGASMGLSQARILLDGVERDCHAVVGPLADVRLTGSSVLFIDMDHYLVQGQIRSLCIVLAVVFALMAGLFGSLRIGLLAMIPNVLPITLMLGLMGWLDLPLDGLTVMIACIAIGIGVDDTIHYLHRLRHERGRQPDLRQAMTHTMAAVGRPIVFTSVVLTLGFWIFCVSDFLGTRNFGFLTGVTVLVALLADLVVLPAVLLLVGVPRGWGRSTDARR
jgi:uncharacterized protein